MMIRDAGGCFLAIRCSSAYKEVKSCAAGALLGLGEREQASARCRLRFNRDYGCQADGLHAEMADIMTWMIGLSHHIGQRAQNLFLRITGKIPQGQSLPRFSIVGRPMWHCGIRPQEFLLHCRKTPQL